jgi:hypothetical protein
MNHSYQMTRHAFERATSRSIPPMIAELIMEYGDSFDAGSSKMGRNLDSARS